MIQMRLGLLASAPESLEPSSPRIERSERKAIHLPSGLQCGSSSSAEWVNGRNPFCAFQSHRSWRYTLFFQSGASVAITAEAPSGESCASEMSVVLRNSSSVMVGFADWADVAMGGRDTQRNSASRRSFECISALYLRKNDAPESKMRRSRKIFVCESGRWKFCLRESGTT